MLKKFALLSALIVLPSSLVAECVVLLHGLGRLSNSMSELETKLAPAGYAVANIMYPSRSQPIDVLAIDAIGRGLAQCRRESSGKIHFITHSLGGILLRYYLTDNTIDELGRVVMLGPPNQGSKIVDGLLPIPGFGFIGGPAGVALGTGEGSIIDSLGPVEFDLGIIAGSTNINPLEFLFIAGPSDSIVSIESTKVQGMNAHRVLPVTHTFMMRNNEVIEEAIHYLKTGSFISEPVDE
ncbi:MAG: alpha/beta hydrolase [SAR86 cluster bacterium]|uniref:Alpha/beta hydrolase n=1 Tax=SAR86 cluster bacterium TaxID=2030880 RepID=A0A2A4X757_9GAMM|nr:MAG: alpha/beta hydrolase [SAR86 cluster bacterium]